MAASMRNLLLRAHHTVKTVCYCRNNLNTRSPMLQIPVMSSNSSTKAKFYYTGRSCSGRPLFKAGLSTQARPPIAGFSSQSRTFSLLTGNYNAGIYNAGLLQRLCLARGASPPLQHQPNRTVIRFSRNKGKKKTVKAVTARFYRFHNGLWLRTIAGRNKKRWKKSTARRRRTKWHVFCSKSQSKKLDLMVTQYWKKRRYFPDDPLEPFQERNFKGLNFYPGKNILRKREDS